MRSALVTKELSINAHASNRLLSDNGIKNTTLITCRNLPLLRWSEAIFDVPVLSRVGADVVGQMAACEHSPGLESRLFLDSPSLKV